MKALQNSLKQIQKQNLLNKSLGQRLVYNDTHVHFKIKKEQQKSEVQSLQSKKAYSFPHPIWSKEQVENCKITFKERITIGDSVAYYFINALRLGFDVMSGYTPIFPWQSKVQTESAWINRIIFLETVAGVPGFVGAMVRHLRSLRQMKRDQGWIHTQLEEAENERVHLITFLNVKNPTNLFRTGVVLTQAWYVALFSSMYFLFPRMSHRVVGYLEEQAVVTYTHLIEEIRREGSPVHHWQTQKAPEVAIEYWNLGENGTMEDVVLAIRKDEEHHREVNHELADDYSQNKPNPFPPGY